MRLALIALLLVSRLASAAGKPPVDAKGAGATPLFGDLAYLDGAEARHAWLDPKAFIEFDASQNVARLMLKLDASAKPLAVGKNRLWTLAGLDAATVREVLARKLPKTHVAPVYRDAPSTAGRARAMTGEVLVTMRGQATATPAFLTEYGLILVRTLPPATHAVVVRPKSETDPLALAGRLAKVDGVASVSAVWWLESAAR